MTREEELKKLETMRDFFCAMSEDEMFDYFYENSPSFRKDFDGINTFETDNQDFVIFNSDANYAIFDRQEEYVVEDDIFQIPATEAISWQMVA